MLTWKDYLHLADQIGLKGSGLDIDGAEEYIAKWTVTHFRPKRPEQVASVFPLNYFQEKLEEFFSEISLLLVPLLYRRGKEIKETHEELFIEMVFLKHETLTLGNAAKELDSDAQFFDIWQKLSAFSGRIDKCLELTPGGTFEENDESVFYRVKGDVPDWSSWANKLAAISYPIEIYDLGEDAEERIRAVLALRPEENIKALEISREQIEVLLVQRRKLERENQGMLSSLRKSRRR